MSKSFKEAIIEKAFDRAYEDEILLFSEQKVAADTNFDREYKDTVLPRINRMNKYYVKIFGLVLRKSTFYNLLICLMAVAFIVIMTMIFA